MSIRLLLLILAAVFFALGAFRVGGPVDWTNAGLFCLTIALWQS